MSYQFSIDDLIGKFFGWTRLSLYRPVIKELAVEKQSQYTVPLQQNVLLGKPLLGEVTLSNNDKKVTVYGLVTFAQSKNIVTTAIAGRQGTVKEYISDGDWTINIQTLLIGKSPKEFPEADFKALMDVLRIGDSLKVTGDLFKLLKIYNIVVKDITLGRNQGFVNVQPVDIQALSDDPPEFMQVDKIQSRKL